MLLGCATGSAGAHTTQENSYAADCTKTDNYGTIDAHEVINMQNKTTFHAEEYIKCPDGRNLVIITWEGTHDKTNANLAAQVMARFFSYFHGGEHIKYLLVPEESDQNVLVYEFEYYQPQRTILRF